MYIIQSLFLCSSTNAALDVQGGTLNVSGKFNHGGYEA